ncbi:hypothetical protein BCR34DRAFT_594959 [Clohesyomyces aquaticus]|uniref:Vacuolar ATPase assembly protein VMA22 n=1 Tax=Clohesyomyces aquaticus TaxID=1231657 RepID=A0A1Y1Y1Z0_9PLEO|nr:hypothetical protein BCR34DRAFT_594959 [Clohesyomyces aquaticus]
MAEVQTQAIFTTTDRTVEKGDLISKLDDLLEQYLTTLDRYQKAQQQLTSFLSSGFLSLAKANFNNRSNARYGQDYYDERMQATKTVIISGEDPNVTFACSPTSGSAPIVAETESADTKTPVEEKETSESPSPETATPTTQPQSEDANDASSGDNKIRLDPLRWFGILVPPELRSAQSSFVSAVEGRLPEVVTVMKELRRLEVEIGRLRKQIKKS